ncbi:MAG: hypothetical protein WA103_02560 [Minisyncoccales bacterium]
MELGILLAAAFWLVAFVSFDFNLIKTDRVKWLVSSLKGVAVGTVVVFCLIYFAQVKMIPYHVLICFFALWAVSSVMIHGSESTPTIAVAVSAIMAVGLIAIGPLNAATLHSIPGVEEMGSVGENETLISDQHIRVICQETAVFRAGKKIGNIGDKYDITNAHIQNIAGQLVWLLPIEYGDPIKAWKYGDQGTPGYVRVSAENNFQEPIRVVGWNMTYVPSAILGYNLERRIYFKYPGYFQKEHVFQLNDKGKPIYVTMLTEPTILGVAGEKPVGIIVTDPESGEMDFYSVNEAPDYLQRIMDESLLEEYLGWWGKYGGGFWNSIFGQEGVRVPTGLIYYADDEGRTTISHGGTDVFLVYGKDGRQYWFGAISMPNRGDSMVGYVLADVKDPANIKFYPLEGLFNDIGAAKKIQSLDEVARVMGYYTAQPIVYSLEGRIVWIAPVLTWQNDELVGVGMSIASENGDAFMSPTIGGLMAKFNAFVEASALPDNFQQEDQDLVAEIIATYNQLGQLIGRLNQTQLGEEKSSPFNFGNALHFLFFGGMFGKIK